MIDFGYKVHYLLAFNFCRNVLVIFQYSFLL